MRRYGDAAAYSCRVGALLDTVGGLPVHPLVVHFAVVLIPLAALGAILMAAWPAFSRRFGTLVVIVAGVGFLAGVAAKESGEQMAAGVGSPEEHAELGDLMPIVGIALFLLVLAFWLFDRGIPMNRPRPLWLILLSIALVIVSVFAMWWTFRVGHTGAESVWAPVSENEAP